MSEEIITASNAAQAKELGEKLIKIEKEQRDVNKANQAEIKTISEGITFLKKQADEAAKKFHNNPLVNDKLEKLEKEYNKVSDQLKTICLKVEANKKYATIEGLAETLSNKDDYKANENLWVVAKSILKDPFKEEAREVFHNFLKHPKNANYESKMAEFKNKVLTSNVKVEDSYIKKSITSAVAEQAGYLAPPEFDLKIQKQLFETSPLRQVATVVMTNRLAYEFVIRTILPTAVWTNTEIKAETTSEQKYGIGRININELSARPRISLIQLEDTAINIESELRRDLAEAFMLAENKAFIKGDGTNQPQGLEFYAKQSASSHDVTKPLKLEFVTLSKAKYDGTNGTPYLANALLDLEGALFSAYKQGAYYLISRPVKNLIRQVVDNNKQYLYSNFQGWGGVQGVPRIRDGVNGMVAGYPILECDDLPTQVNVVDTYPIYFGNFKKYKICDRIGLTLIVDNVTQPGYVIYFFRKRLGAGFTMTQGVKVLKVVA